MMQTNFVPPPSMPPNRRPSDGLCVSVRHAHRYHHRTANRKGGDSCRVCRRRDTDTLPRMNRRLVLWSVVSALAGFLFGFDTVVISGAEQRIQSLWGLSAGAHGLAMGAALYGTVVGSLFGGWPTDRFGRKPTLIAIGVLYVVSAFGCAFAPGVGTFIAARFLGGLGIGVSTVAAPLYISEIAPPAYRGRLAGMFQFNIVFGIVVAFASNAVIARIGGEEAWRWMLGVAAVPSVVYAVMCFGLPESPRWLIGRRGDRAAGLAVLKRGRARSAAGAPRGPRGRDPRGRPRREGAVVRVLDVAAAHADPARDPHRLLQPVVRHQRGALLRAAHLRNDRPRPRGGAAAVGGHRRDQPRSSRSWACGSSTGSAGGRCSISARSATSFRWGSPRGRSSPRHYAIVPVCIFAFIASHAIGQGAVIWVFISEIFPNRHRAEGQALGSFTHWVFAALLTTFFPRMVAAFAPGLRVRVLQRDDGAAARVGAPDGARDEGAVPGGHPARPWRTSLTARHSPIRSPARG